jgi:hypothetical protein
VGAVIVGLLKCKSGRTRLETLAFLGDTLYGRPAQNVSLSGAVVHAHGLWRPLENARFDHQETVQSKRVM